MTHNPIPSLNAASREAWEQIAGWWDDFYTADGNASHRELIAPAPCACWTRSRARPSWTAPAATASSPGGWRAWARA